MGVGVSLPAVWIVGPARKAWRAMSPRPEFLPPQQRAGVHDTPTLSYWHVPISLKRPLLGKKKFERCTIWLIRLWGENAPGEGIALRWQSRDGPSVSRETLVYGETIPVPIARRDEAETNPAVITNENYLNSRGKDIKWPLTTGRYEFWLEVRAGHKRWRSPHRYVLKVPPDSVSNGHFTLAILYRD